MSDFSIFIISILTIILIFYLTNKILPKKKIFKYIFSVIEFILVLIVIFYFNKYQFFIFTFVVLLLLIIAFIQGRKKIKLINRRHLYIGEIAVLVACGLISYSLFVIKKKALDHQIANNMEILYNNMSEYMDGDIDANEYDYFFADKNHVLDSYYYYHAEVEDSDGNLIVNTDDKNNYLTLTNTNYNYYTPEVIYLNEFFTDEQVDDFIDYLESPNPKNKSSTRYYSRDYHIVVKGHMDGNKHIISEVDIRYGATTAYIMGEASEDDIDFTDKAYKDESYYIMYLYFNKLHFLNTRDTTIQRGKALLTDDYTQSSKTAKRYGVYKIYRGRIDNNRYTILMYADTAIQALKSSSFYNPVCLVIINLHTIAAFILQLIVNKKAEKLEQMKRREILANAILLEMDSPSKLIQDSLKAIDQSDDLEKKEEYSKTVDEQTEVLNDLKNYILTCTKNNTYVIKKERVLVSDIINRASKYYRDKDVTFDIQSDDKINADVRYIGFIIKSLIANALNNTKQSVTVKYADDSFTISYAIDPNDHMIPDWQPLYEEFNRNDDVKDMKLAISANLLELHESKYGCHKFDDHIEYFFSV